MGTFKDEEENIKRGFQLVDSTIEGPYFKIYDEYNNMEYGHSSNSHLTFENESLFNLKKLKCQKLKLTLPSVTYRIGNNFEKNDFKVSLSVPAAGKALINRVEEFKDFKYKIVSIERLSDKKIAIQYNFINDSNSKLQVFDMGINNYNCSSSSSGFYEGNYRTIITSENIIGDEFELNSITMGYASVGPFEVELDLNKIK